MKKLLTLGAFVPFFVFGQGVNITSWKINTTGQQAQYYNSSSSVITLNDSAEVQQVCYNNDSIYVRTNILAGYIMGPWPGDPFIAAGQNNSYIFPRNPVYPSTTHPNKPTGAMGLLLNGVILFDDGDGKSYNSATNTNSNNGQGVWNQIAWVAHAAEMDAGNGHPDPQNTYHNHSNPVQLCSVTDASQHSPIIGWAFDGWPIYGPFGYSSAMNSGSTIKRMTSSWALRNITTRTTLYTGATTSQTGPAVSTAFPLGTYIEDYGYTAGSGDLDYYNGRYCVTPEFPAGTYAYFLNTNTSGNASYPNCIGPKYYGSIFMANNGPTGGSATIKTNITCYSPSVSLNESIENNSFFKVFPNPSNSNINLRYNGKASTIQVMNTNGQVVYKAVGDVYSIDISNLNSGMYNILVSGIDFNYRTSFIKQ